ncbi:DUF2267 domain-containing protein [Roseibium salinum]|nr:DUF2267 domain-containing protein [Roseibium salinum]
MLQTHHQAYHTLRAVLHTFRDHLTTEQALAFAGVLPAVTRAIFVEDWQPSDLMPDPFPDRATLIREVQSVRRDHNLAPDSAIENVASALRRSSVDERELDRILATFPDAAAAYWKT